MTVVARFAIIPGGAVEITADEGALGHFSAEYGSPSGTAPVRVVVVIQDRLPAGRAADIEGGHKTVGWAVALGPAGADPLRATIALHGRPRWFGTSLAQGFIVEPLISLAAAAHGHVLVPAAAIGEDGGVLLLLGKSRSGKSSLSARALAVGRDVLGDDQVLVDAGGMAAAFPRRMRVYDDLVDTAPLAVRALPSRIRLALRLRRVLRVGTGGYVAPSLAIARTAFGGSAAPGPLPIHRTVVVERSGTARELSSEPATAEDVCSLAMEILREQRQRLSGVRRTDWEARLEATIRQEQSILRAALATAPAYRVSVPNSWDARTSITALAEALGIG